MGSEMCIRDRHLSFTDEAVKAIAHQSFERKTGARGLRAIMETAMMEYMFEIPSDESIRECVITEDVILGKGKAEYKRLDNRKKAGRKTGESA